MRSSLQSLSKVCHDTVIHTHSDPFQAPLVFWHVHFVIQGSTTPAKPRTQALAPYRCSSLPGDTAKFLKCSSSCAGLARITGPFPDVLCRCVNIRVSFLYAQRRQRRLVEHHHPSLGLGGIVGHSNALPQLVPVNGTSMHGPTGFGAATKPVFTSTLPKVHLPHHHQTGTSALLPGILKTNMMQPKVFNKAKLKVSA